MNSIMIIGIGQIYRSDDGIGLIVAERLRSLLGHREDICVLNYQGDLIHLMELWSGTSMVILIDSIQPQGRPGSIALFAAHERSLPTICWQTSTHSTGLSEVIELAKVLGNCPPALYVFGIEGKNFQIGDTLTSSVAKSSDVLISRIRQIIENGNRITHEQLTTTFS